MIIHAYYKVIYTYIYIYNSMVRACIMTMLPCCISIVLRRRFRFFITRSTTTEKRKRIQLLMYPLQIPPSSTFPSRNKNTIATHAESLKDILLVHGLETCGEFSIPRCFLRFSPAFFQSFKTTLKNNIPDIPTTCGDSGWFWFMGIQSCNRKRMYQDHVHCKGWNNNYIWMFPKIMVPPNHPF